MRVEDPARLRRHARADRAAGRATARSTACGSTTRTAWPTPRATSPGSRRPPAAPGSSWRRSSSPASGCPTRGRPPARPATTCSTASSGCSSTPRARRRSPTLWESETGSRTTYEQVVDTTKHLVLDRVLAGRGRAARRARPAGLPHRPPAARHHPPAAARGARRGARGVRRSTGPTCPGRARRRRRARARRARRGGRVGRPPGARRRDRARRPARPRGGAGGRGAAQEFVVRFQQTCGPVMAKGVEDTAFYRYLRLAALNEVGGDPGRFGLPLAEFHAACDAAQRELAAVADHAVDPRHQAQRGRPRPAGPARAVPDRVGRGGGAVVRAGGPAPHAGRPGQGHRAAGLAEPARRLADQRGPGRGVRREGDPRGQGAHLLGRPGAGVRRGGRGVRARRARRPGADRRARGVRGAARARRGRPRCWPRSSCS